MCRFPESWHFQFLVPSGDRPFAARVAGRIAGLKKFSTGELVYGLVIHDQSMKTFHLILGVAVPVLTGSPSGSGAEKTINDELIGTWECVSATINGKPLTPEAIKRFSLALTKERYKTTRGNSVLFDSTFTLDSAKSPIHINLVGTEGDLAGMTAQGILLVEDRILKICYTMPGKPRPTAFESPVGSEIYFIVWKRKPSE